MQYQEIEYNSKNETSRPARPNRLRHHGRSAKECSCRQQSTRRNRRGGAFDVSRTGAAADSRLGVIRGHHCRCRPLRGWCRSRSDARGAFAPALAGSGRLVPRLRDRTPRGAQRVSRHRRRRFPGPRRGPRLGPLAGPRPRQFHDTPGGRPHSDPADFQIHADVEAPDPR